MTLKEKMYEVIFEAETKAGRAFDVGLIIAVFLSIIVVMLETVESIQGPHGVLFDNLEWFFTIIFTLELMARLYCSEKKLKYLFSFYGLVDIVSILPSYLLFLFPAGQSFLMVRTLRMLRIFRVLKLKNYTTAGQKLGNALRASFPKIIVFTGFVVSVVIIIGTVMYMIESKEAGFTSIPKATYWAIVTMTTVGYGDITPQTVIGQVLSSLLMITGYVVIAIPTGLVTAELARGHKKKDGKKHCPHCDGELE